MFFFPHPADLADEVCVGGHVGDGERLVGRVVEQTLVESGGEEADRRTTVNQRERQQAAYVKVQVVTQSWGERHTRKHTRTHTRTQRWELDGIFLSTNIHEGC